MTNKKKSTTRIRQEVISGAVAELEILEQDLTELRDKIAEAISSVIESQINGELAAKIRKSLSSLEAIGTLHDELDDVRSSLEEKFSNTDRYSRLEEILSTLDEQKTAIDQWKLPEEVPDVDGVSEFMEGLGSFIDEVSEAQGALEGLDVDYVNG